MTALRWLPVAPEAATPDPEDIARRILARLQLQAPELGIFPRGDTAQRMGYVGWHMWLWADPQNEHQWGPISATDTEEGLAVTLSAHVAKVSWNVGDGTTITCGRGTPWSEPRTHGGRNIASPDCGHRYERAATYTITATAEWEVAWSGGGRSGTLPLTLTRSSDVIVGEMQSLIVNS